MSPIIVSVLVGGAVVVVIVVGVVAIGRRALGQCTPEDVPRVVAALAGLVRAFCGLRAAAPPMAIPADAPVTTPAPAAPPTITPEDTTGTGLDPLDGSQR